MADYLDTMTPPELKAARRELGLSVKQMADMLEIDHVNYRKHEFHPSASQFRPLPRRAARLIRAYLAGHRPDDWPEGK